MLADCHVSGASFPLEAVQLHGSHVWNYTARMWFHTDRSESLLLAAEPSFFLKIEATEPDYLRPSSRGEAWLLRVASHSRSGSPLLNESYRNNLMGFHDELDRLILHGQIRQIVFHGIAKPG